MPSEQRRKRMTGGVADAIALTPAVERIYRDIDQKRRTTRDLHTRPALVEPVVEIHS